jgi:23S rRNA A2030 N6-methylase RlmJ
MSRSLAQRTFILHGFELACGSACTAVHRGLPIVDPPFIEDSDWNR